MLMFPPQDDKNAVSCTVISSNFKMAWWHPDSVIGADQPTQWWMVVASYPGLDRRTTWQPLRLVGTVAAKTIQDVATTHGRHSQIVHVLVIVAWPPLFLFARSRSNQRRIQNSVSILLLHVVGEMRHFCILLIVGVGIHQVSFAGAFDAHGCKHSDKSRERLFWMPDDWWHDVADTARCRIWIFGSCRATSLCTVSSCWGVCWRLSILKNETMEATHRTRITGSRK